MLCLGSLCPLPRRCLPAQSCIASSRCESVQAYATEYNLCMLDIPDMSEKDRVDRFLRGLKVDVRVLVELQKPVTLNAPVELATSIDSIMWRSRRNSNVSRAHVSGPRHGTSGPVPMELGSAELEFFWCSLVGVVVFQVVTSSRGPPPRWFGPWWSKCAVLLLQGFWTCPACVSQAAQRLSVFLWTPRRVVGHLHDGLTFRVCKV